MFLCLLPRIRRATSQFHGNEPQRSAGCIVRVLQIAGIIFATICLVFIIADDIDLYRSTVPAYQNGDYETVEGYVENFKPMPKQGHAKESFEIDGIHFEYSQNSYSSGYSKTLYHGGVICGEGQYLVIGYIMHPSHGNIIVYIEQPAQ